MSADLIEIELHCHSHASPDCLLDPGDILRVCRERRIDRIAITDHDHIAGARAAAALDPTRVIIGEEIMTTGGEILAYFVSEQVPSGLSPERAIAELRRQGAFISISHPFDPLRAPWMAEQLAELADQIDAVEVLNGRALSQKINEAARQFAHEHDLLGTAGSDAHSLYEIGRVRMRLPRFDDAAGMRAALRSAEIIGELSPPWVKLSSRFAALAKALGWRPASRPGVEQGGA